MKDDRPDSALVREAKAGGPIGRLAFGELVRRHQSWLVGLLSHLLSIPPIEAEEFAQEALVRVFAALDRLPDEVDFRAWVRVSALRLAFNARRNTQTRAQIRSSFPPPAPNASSADALEARELLGVVLETLPYPYREILILRHVEELSLEEIARHIEVGLSGAKMRLKRAREAFVQAHESLSPPEFDSAGESNE